MLGKFLAAWAFTGIALVLTFPMWITVNCWAEPDNGVILSSYVGSLLMAGGFLAIGSCMSALTSNQVIAFVLTVVVCFLFMLSGFPLVLDAFRAWAPQRAGRRDRLVELPHPFQRDRQGRDRRCGTCCSSCR